MNPMNGATFASCRMRLSSLWEGALEATVLLIEIKITDRLIVLLFAKGCGRFLSQNSKRWLAEIRLHPDLRWPLPP